MENHQAGVDPNVYTMFCIIVLGFLKNWNIGLFLKNIRLLATHVVRIIHL